MPPNDGQGKDYLVRGCARTNSLDNKKNERVTLLWANADTNKQIHARTYIRAHVFYRILVAEKTFIGPSPLKEFVCFCF